MTGASPTMRAENPSTAGPVRRRTWSKNFITNVRRRNFRIGAGGKKTGGSGFTDFRDEPPSRQPPVPGDCSLRKIQHCRSLLHAQSAKVTKLDDFRLAWIGVFQLVERVVQNQE